MQQTDLMGWTPAQVSSVLARDLHARRLLREAGEHAGQAQGSLDGQMLTRARHHLRYALDNLDLLEQRLTEKED